MDAEAEKMTDERRLRRFAMDVVRGMAEGAVDPQMVRDLGVKWGLLEAGESAGEPWLNFTSTLLGDELTRPSPLAH